MKRWIRFLIWLAGLALFLALTAHFTLRHALNTPKFKAAATGFIQRTTGRPADFERIDYTLFPFSLVVRNAALREPDGSRDFASLKELSVYVDFRTKEITSIQLAEPTIRIVQHPDGTFNFSDLLAPPPAKDTPPPPAPPEQPAPPSPPSAAPFALRQVQIDKARFEFITPAPDGSEHAFRISNLDFLLQDLAPGRPIRMTGKAAIGQRSSMDFTFSAAPPADSAGNPAAWPLDFQSRLDIRDFADLQAFLPAGALPFQSLSASLHLRGSLANGLTAILDLQTPGATDTHPVELRANLRAELSLPAPVAEHLLAGAPLPDSFQFSLPPCTPPPGTMAWTGSPAATLLLRHLHATAEATFPLLAYGPNRFTDGTASLRLTDGILILSNATVSAYGGSLHARGSAHLLECPLTYRLDLLEAQQLALEQALAANGLEGENTLSGRLQFDARMHGQAVAAPGLQTLAGRAHLRIDDLQSVGTAGSLMDQAWRQLDNPLLLELLPRLRPKVDQARAAAATVTTTRYETATASLDLRNGVATLSETRLAMPDYRLDLSGTLRPFEDQLDLAAQLIASPAETERLTHGKDRSAYLPYVEGGLMVPLSIRGSLRQPRVRPDLDRLLQNALTGDPSRTIPSPLENLSDSDKKHVQEGLKVLQGLGTLLK